MRHQAQLCLGDLGLGLVVGPAAMRIAIEKAAAVGTGWVAVKNSNHYGIAGYHAMLPLEHDMIGLTMSNASPLNVPTFSKERLLGTNPIAVAFPADQEAPFVADFATVTAEYGKLELLQRSNAKAPSGWLQDANGNSSQDPRKLLLTAVVCFPLAATGNMGVIRAIAWALWSISSQRSCLVPIMDLGFRRM